MSSNEWQRKRSRGEEKDSEEKQQEAKSDHPEPPAEGAPPANAPPRGPPGAPGYYPPPPYGEGSPYPPPPRGYEGGPPPYPPPYGMPPPGYPPHYMPPPYGMYPYPPPYGMPPYYPDPRYAEDPYASSRDDRKPPARPSDRPAEDSGDEEEEEDAAVTARLKTYIKPRIPSTQEVLDRRARKNAQSRTRAAKIRSKIQEVVNKPAEERDDDEQVVVEQYEQRRKRKNDRSRERALEKKEEIDRILAKPEKKRSKIERQFLETALSAKKRKNEGDRLRRQRLKELGLSSKSGGGKPGVTARGPLPSQYPHGQPPAGSSHPGYGHHPGMGDIPMSPLPSLPHHHHPPYHPMQSPGGFGSPGMMPGMGYPSPHRRGPATPGRSDVMPYMPPPQAYDQSSPGQRPPQNRVEQRRNPDGSMSIQIGGQASGRAPFGGDTRTQESESDLLNENDDDQENEEQGNDEEGDEGGTED